MRNWLVNILRCPSCGGSSLQPVAEESLFLSCEPSPYFDRPCHKHNRENCPECDGESIRTGHLACRCGSKYPIINFVPFFSEEISDKVSHRTAECFDYLWSMIPYNGIYGRTEGQDMNVFRVKTGKHETSLVGKLVLDAGCGDGSLLFQLARKGAHAVGCDLSVPKFMYTQGREQVMAFVQCDILNLPFRDGIFDLVYSIGVLHHIKRVQTAIENLARVTSKVGELSVWVYDSSRAKFKTIDDAIRAITTKLPDGTVLLLSNILAPMYPFIRRLQGARPRAIRHEDRYHIIYDWLKTPYRKFYKEEDLESLLKKQGLKVLFRSSHSLGLTCGFCE